MAIFLAVEFTPDGKECLVASKEGHIRVADERDASFEHYAMKLLVSENTK